MSMNTVDSAMSEAEKMRDKFAKAIELALIDPPDVQIGTTPHDVVFTENKLRLLHYRPVVRNPKATPLVMIFALIDRKSVV